MFNPLKSLADLKTMKEQASKMQQDLAQQTVVIDKGNVHLVMRGDQKVQEVTIDGANNPAVVDAFNEAIRKTQEIAAAKLTEMSGGLKGLLGQG